MGDALDGVLNGVGEVVHRVDAPLIALTVMLGVLDTVDGRVPHVHVGAGEVDLSTEGLFALLELARTHPAEQVEVLFRGAVAPRRGTAGLASVAAAVLTHLVAGQVIDVGLSLEDELLGVLVALVEVVAAVEDAAVGVGTQPVQVLDDAVDVLLTLASGVGVVEAEVELAAVLVGDGPVDIDGLGAADVQVAVRLRREAGMDLADLAFGEVGVNDLGQKVFICHVAFPLSGHNKPGITLLIPFMIHYFPLCFKVESRTSRRFRRHFAKKQAGTARVPLPFAKNLKFMLDIRPRILYNNQAFSECDKYLGV